TSRRAIRTIASANATATRDERCEDHESRTRASPSMDVRARRDRHLRARSRGRTLRPSSRSSGGFAGSVRSRAMYGHDGTVTLDDRGVRAPLTARLFPLPPYARPWGLQQAPFRAA